jgi:hypothetical protein
VDIDGVRADLTRVAESVGLEIQRRALRGTHPSLGGLCRLPGRNVVLLSSKATTLERCTLLAAALAELGHATHPGLGGESRALVERRGRPLSPPTAREKRHARPGLAGLGSEGRRRL